MRFTDSHSFATNFEIHGGYRLLPSILNLSCIPALPGGARSLSYLVPSPATVLLIYMKALRILTITAVLGLGNFFMVQVSSNAYVLVAVSGYSVLAERLVSSIKHHSLPVSAVHAFATH